MEKIKDILKLDLTEEIKDVIDLEDKSEKELQFEIENYIVTNRISKYLSDFISLYKSNIKETGIWLSGFYGSGKSYFGKMLGYLLENRIVNGTPFQERFIQRLRGLPNKNLLENEIRGLSSFETIVVFLDIAKQSTKNGFAWTLFKNFLISLGFLDDVFGYIEYGLFLNGEYKDFLSTVKKLFDENWRDIRKNPLNVSKTIKRALTSSIYTEEEYKETKKYLDERIASYDASKFKDEISHYLEKNPDKRIVFIVDEVSEAISQNKIDLLELEGVSEALSAIPQDKVWTIAIAQEKLEDVIQNANVSLKELGKVIDRFKTRIHLSSEEVETVIRERLLLKEDQAAQKLKEFYSENSGQIMDSTSLNAKFPTKSKDIDEFIIDYPFHKYQFQLLQKFLFSVHKMAKTGGTERGMITATHIILKDIKEKELYSFVTAETLVKGGQKVPESELERKYYHADNVLKEQESPVKGSKLLQAIYFLNESSEVDPTSENITKLYLEKLGEYYEFKPKIDKALSDLCNANLLLEKNGKYKITSDLEQKLIDEMRNTNVELHYKKRVFIERIKEQEFVSELSKYSLENYPYNFHVRSLQGDELIYSKGPQYTIIQLASPYTVAIENRSDYIERVKHDTQSNTELATLIPSMNHFEEIDNLIEEIYRYGVLEDRYKNDDDERIRGIIKDFSVNKSNKIGKLNGLIEKSYKEGTFIYHFEEHNVDETNFMNRYKAIQKKIIRNTYTDRLPYQLSEEVGLKVLKEKYPDRLQQYFTWKEFELFDSQGAFIGDNLKVVEKIVSPISSMYIDGKELEENLSKPPYGYTYGTISTVLAVLMRAGKLSVKYNGRTIYDYKDDDIPSVFGKYREFKKADFKAILSKLSLQQKQKIVDLLKETKAQRVLDRSFDYNTNDIELVGVISLLSNHYVEKIDDRKRIISDFDKYFPKENSYSEILKPFIVKVTDANYKAKAEEFLEKSAEYKNAVNSIQKTIDFSEKNLQKLIKYENFIKDIMGELEKLGDMYESNLIFKFSEDFNEKFKESIIDSFSELEGIFQKIKDEYHNLIKEKHDEMSKEHHKLYKESDKQKEEIEKISKELNKDLIRKLNDIKSYAARRSCDNLKIEFDIRCRSCNFSLNEILASNQSISSKYDEIDDVRGQIKYPKEKPKPRELRITINKGKYTALKYKKVLEDYQKRIESLDNDDIVIVE